MSGSVRRWYRAWIKGWFSGSAEKAMEARQASDGTRAEADRLKLLLAELRAQNGH